MSPWPVTLHFIPTHVVRSSARSLVRSAVLVAAGGPRTGPGQQLISHHPSRRGGVALVVTAVRADEEPHVVDVMVGSLSDKALPRSEPAIAHHHHYGGCQYRLLVRTSTPPLEGLRKLHVII